MPNKIDPGFEPGAAKRVIAISIVVLLFGVGIIPMSLAAYRSGNAIPLLSKTRPIYGWEGLLISFLSVVVGIGGIWAGVRKAHRHSTPDGAQNGRL